MLSKKHRVLNDLCNLMEGFCRMYSAGVHPGKVTGARWIIHKKCTMGPVIERLYNIE